jgi:hypothetical protein
MLETDKKCHLVFPSLLMNTKKLIITEPYDISRDGMKYAYFSCQDLNDEFLGILGDVVS